MSGMILLRKKVVCWHFILRYCDKVLASNHIKSAFSTNLLIFCTSKLLVYGLHHLKFCNTFIRSSVFIFSNFWNKLCIILLPGDVFSCLNKGEVEATFPSRPHENLFSQSV